MCDSDEKFVRAVFQHVPHTIDRGTLAKRRHFSVCANTTSICACSLSSESDVATHLPNSRGGKEREYFDHVFAVARLNPRGSDVGHFFSSPPNMMHITVHFSSASAP